MEDDIKTRTKIWLATAGFFLTLGLVAAKTPGPWTFGSKSSNDFAFSPVAEFEPTSGVIVSEFLLSDNTDGEAFVRAILDTGVKLILVTDDFDPPKKLDTIHENMKLSPEQRKQISIIGAPHDSYWLRDFGPQAFRMSNPYQQNLVFFDYIYRDESKLDDTLPYTVAMYLSKTLIHVPIPLDGGNFLTNGRDCLFTDDFDKRFFLDEQGSIELAEKTFRPSHGCERILIFDSDAHEHIDMWAKFIDPDTVLVNEIRPELFVLAEREYIDTRRARIIQKSLDRAAERMAQFYHVIRVPMPFPYEQLFRTYLNFIILNDNAILPRFERQYASKEPYFDQTFLARYEREISEVLSSRALTATFINSDYLISNGGSFHCVTSHIPE